MDALALQILEDELRKDGSVIVVAAAKARQMLEEESAGHLPACGYELNRLYNIAEKSFERVAEAFENHFDKRGDYHERLFARMNLEIHGVRPRFVPDELLSSVRELKGFRHVFRHAYDLELDPGRLEPLVAHAETFSREFAGICDRFLGEVRQRLAG